MNSCGAPVFGLTTQLDALTLSDLFDAAGAPLLPPEKVMKAKWLTICGGFVVTIAAVGRLVSQKPPLRSPEARAAAVQFLRVDDESELVEPATAGVVKDSLPRGVTLMKEQVIIGAGNVAVRTFARVVAVNGESKAAAGEKLLAWTATLNIPEGDRVAIGELSNDQGPSPNTSIGWRTYLVRKNPILTGADVQDTISQVTNQGWAVALRFNPVGTRRFDAYTRANLNRRMATLVDGKVLSVAMIAREIPDGRVQITLPNGNEGRPLADRFVHAITGR